jgi:hypothetical protein
MYPTDPDQLTTDKQKHQMEGSKAVKSFKATLNWLVSYQDWLVGCQDWLVGCQDWVDACFRALIEVESRWLVARVGCLFDALRLSFVGCALDFVRRMQMCSV